MENQPAITKKAFDTCKNCEQQFEESFDFCPYCGQKTNEDLTIGVLFYNTISNYFSVDARFFKSFLPLLFKPGYLPSRFIEGKRLLYLHPAQLYLFISVVFFFLLSTTVVREQVHSVDSKLKETLKKPLVSGVSKQELKQVLDSVRLDSVLKPLKKDNIVIGMNHADIKTLDSIINTNSKTATISSTSIDFNMQRIDSLIAIDAPDSEIYKAMGMPENTNFFIRKLYKQILRFYKERDGGQILQAIYDTIPIALFVLLPIFALILKLLFFKRGQYAHHLVFSFYFFSFLFTVFSIILIVNYFWDVPDWVDRLLVLSTVLYLIIAVKRFYNQGWFLSFFKTNLALFAYFVFVVPIALFLIGLTGFLFY